MMENIQEQEQMDAVVSGVTPGVGVETRFDQTYLETWLYRYVLRERMSYLQVARWQTDKRVSDLPHDALVATAVSSWAEYALIWVREMLVEVVIRSTDVCSASLFASTYAPGDAEAVIAQLKGWLEPKQAAETDRVLVGFHYMVDGDTRYRTRRIEAPAWQEIRGNYTAGVHAQIDGLVSSFEPGVRGRLILFHGPPGTGKTYVIRTLAREWRTWCTFEYVADPEKFFGSAGYMMEVLLDSAEDDDDDDYDAAPRWRMLVIEDAGELLARDARTHQGQGLSRLLNMSEGLFGQGLRVMTMISTNDPLDSLNEAVARPGRTAAEVEFAPLTAGEANAWLASNDSGRDVVEEEMTLAELYALVQGAEPAPRKARRAIGFGRN